MPTPQPSSFTATMEHAALHREREMWQAAQTVRAHVTDDAGLASMLDCLGLADALRPSSL